ncbi:MULTISPECIES: PP2C family protein-serine/threonine phosphatase [unclassified Streptomyces]|uniref:PP2C family protein-serine/threonine phosphatase n=1 Tax=unclassified Streptomyces TaxID=2593676 RepID=UPI0011CE7697|nr:MULTISPECIES: SpoIIE family protein phosphatase [unclassified Streptomyces]TXS79056.1 PAS domain S-box protein [Streptomyces sp. me109]
MPSPLSADRPAAQPPRRGDVEALISQTRRLRGEMDAVRRDAPVDGADARGRWQRALCDLAMHQLDDLDQHLAQLREGPPQAPAEPADEPDPHGEGSLLTRVGSAEWNLLTDAASWSPELYQILGRDPATAPLTLDELPSLVLEEDRPMLTAMVTDCLVDAKPIDREFRVVRPDGQLRTVHIMGEPVLDTDGSTAAMWAVLRDVSELRRSQRAVSETRASLRHDRNLAQNEHRLAAALQKAVLRPCPDSRRTAPPGAGTLDLAARHLPSPATAPTGGRWHDALELPDGETVLSVGDLTGHGVTVASGMAMLLGALRGMAMAGTRPGQLMSWLDRLVDSSAQPVLGSAVCCRYAPESRILTWAQAGHPAPLLFRNGTGRMLTPPHGVLLGATSGAAYGQAEEPLEDGDLLLLHTDGLVPRCHGAAAVQRLLDLAPRFGGAGSAQDCVRILVEEFGDSRREDDACVLVARIG